MPSYPSGKGVNYPAVGQQYTFSMDVSGPGGTILWGDQANDWVVHARLGFTIALLGDPNMTFSLGVPNVDDNLGIYLETPSNDAGTITTVGTAGTGTGTAFGAGDVGKLLLITSAGNPIKQANLITARASTTAITLQEAFNPDASGHSFKLLTKLYQASNQVAQTPVNYYAAAAATLTENGNYVIHCFFNNDGNTQMAFNVILDVLEKARVTFWDCGN